MKDVKVPYEMGPEGTGSLISQLSLQHMESVRYYKAAAESLAGKNEKGSAFFKDLATYRHAANERLNEILSDIGSGVNTPSKGDFSYIKEHEDRFSKAVATHNTVEMADMAYENEQATSDAYRHALANGNLLDFAEEVLHEQHEEILRWVNKADRYKTVPQDNINE